MTTRVVQPLGHRPHELCLDSVVERSRLRRFGDVPVFSRRAPTHEEVLGDVSDDRSLEPNRAVVPAQPVAARVIVRVEPVPAQRRQVDPADEGRLVVDDDELLVVTVERPLLRVEAHRDACVADELVTRLSHLAPVRMEERQRRARPREHAHIDSLGRLGEQLPQGRPSVLESE